MSFHSATATSNPPLTTPTTPTPPASHSPFPLIPPNLTQSYLNLFSSHSHPHPQHNPTLPTHPQYPLPNYSPHPTRHHSPIVQKVLANAF
ncbi:hypothetical protein FKK54_22660 [Klebsiella pneumoniae]|nr:hypothetical protein [Klebsiella pneumoniae]MBK2915583.1 hypothetical protein [Klebsiella pneumoniae]